MKMDVKQAVSIDVGVFFLAAILGSEIKAGPIFETIMNAIAFLAFVGFCLLLPVYLSERSDERNSPENVAARKAAEEAKQAARAAKQAEWEAQYAEIQAQKQAKLYAEGKVIVEVKLMDGGMTVQKSGGLGGFIVGDLVAGPVGGMIGATSKKNHHQKQKFAVKYSDGHIEIVQLNKSDKRYAELMKYVKWDEI